MSLDPLNHLKLIDRKTLLKLLPLSRATLFRLERRGDFPAAIKLGRNKVGYRVIDVEAFLQNGVVKAAIRGVSR